MKKKEIFEEIMKLDHKERVELVGAVVTEFSAEELSGLVQKKAPGWASSKWGKIVIGAATAVAGLLAGYLVNEAEQTPQLPDTDTTVEVQAEAK